MSRFRIALFIAITQVVFTIVLLELGWRQNFRMSPDMPFDGPISKIEMAMNMPVTGLVTGLNLILIRTGRESSFLNELLRYLYFFSVFVLWFVLSLDVQSLIKRSDPSRRRIAFDCFAVGVGLVLLLLAIFLGQSAEIIVAVGSATWGITLSALYGVRVARRIALRRRRLPA